MLQKRGLGLVDQHECFTVAPKVKLQQQFAQKAMSFNFHLTMIEAPISLFSVTKEL